MFRRVAQSLEAVTLAINRMPQRHKHASLREEQEEHPIDDDQCLLEAVLCGDFVLDQRTQNLGRCGEHAVAKRSADADRAAIGTGDQRVQRARIIGPAGERRRTKEPQ